jgi:hypothetical protein
LTPLASANSNCSGKSMDWLRAIKTETVTMVRSRGDRPGRFHSSPAMDFSA